MIKKISKLCLCLVMLGVSAGAVAIWTRNLNDSVNELRN